MEITVIPHLGICQNEMAANEVTKHGLIARKVAPINALKRKNRDL